jgi:hypothetical protein
MDGARKDDPGVPGAEQRALGELLAVVSAARVDGLWRFPPLRKGRRESGLLAAGLFADDAGAREGEEAAASASDPDRRILVTLAWRAEETGKGITFESRFEEQGEAPRDRLPRVMTGVTRRMDEAAGEPRYLSVGGDPALLEALREELEP